MDTIWSVFNFVNRLDGGSLGGAVKTLFRPVLGKATPNVLICFSNRDQKEASGRLLPTKRDVERKTNP
jgi:hypothetical protein